MVVEAAFDCHHRAAGSSTPGQRDLKEVNSMSRSLRIPGLLALGLLATHAYASASDTLPGTNTTTPVTFSFGSGANIWSVQIYSCNEAAGGTPVTGDCANEQVSGVVAANGSLALTYSSLSGSNLLATTVGGTNQDLSLDEIVTAPTGETVSSVVLSLTGVTTSGVSDGNEPADVHTSETGVGNPVAVNTNMANGASPFSVTQYLSSPLNSLTIQKDMAAGGSKGTPGDTLDLTTVTQTFNVPEPASLAVLLVGLGGLISTRRRRAAATD
jgi:hypothetical protein